jgi:hypothetical protein
VTSVAQLREGFAGSREGFVLRAWANVVSPTPELERRRRTPFVQSLFAAGGA